LFIQKGFIKTNTKKVGIVMPYYNDAAFVNNSINSIIAQTYTDWHLYVIDDGSESDKAAKHVIINKDARITIIEKKNGGPSSARNLALQIIKEQNYDFVAYCDSDDMWPKNYLTEQLSNLESCDLSYCSADNLFDNGNKAYTFGIPDPEEWPGVEFMFRSPFIYISGVVHKAKCLEVGYFDSELDCIEDWDMWMRMAKHGFVFKKTKM
jgi:glycosyltransferase involved in cell wall biosynthesis